MSFMGKMPEKVDPKAQREMRKRNEIPPLRGHADHKYFEGEKGRFFPGNRPKTHAIPECNNLDFHSAQRKRRTTPKSTQKICRRRLYGADCEIAIIVPSWEGNTFSCFVFHFHTRNWIEFHPRSAKMWSTFWIKDAEVRLSRRIIGMNGWTL